MNAISQIGPISRPAWDSVDYDDAVREDEARSLPVWPTLDRIMRALTDAQIDGYIRHNRLSWITSERVRENWNLRLKAAQHVYAGENPMAHHIREARGPADVFFGLGSPENAKGRAGAHLVSARLNRSRGNMKGARAALENASAARRTAQRVISGRDPRHPFRMIDNDRLVFDGTAGVVL